MVEKPCRWGTKMYRKPTGQISLLEDFRFFAGGTLDANNRWVKMADLIEYFAPREPLCRRNRAIITE